jgi:putative transposase
MSRIRKHHSPEFKLKAVVEILKGEKTATQLGGELGVHPIVLTVEMKKRGFFVGQKRVRTAMQTMGLEAIYRKPNLSAANKEHKKFPYLLRDLVVDRPDHAWAADITYIPMSAGFGYLFAIIDWFSRYVIEWELSNLLDTDFCIEALERGLLKRKPEIFNTDQGVQFTSHHFTERLENGGIRISMDGKGRALDNVFVERLWRSVKYEDIYPKGYLDFVHF